VTGPLLATLSLLVPGLEPTFIRDRIRDGSYGIIVSVQSWNGQPNDPNVLVSLRMAVGTENDPDGGDVRPKFDGNDVWTIDPGSIVAGETLVGMDCKDVGCVGLATDINAYVSNGVLVASFESLPLALTVGSGRLDIPFVGAVIVAQLTQGPGGYRLAGEIAGRWPADRLLAAAGAIRDPVTKTSLCNNAQSYNLFKRSVCTSVDLAVMPSRDRTGAPCEAMSEAIRFTASQAKVGKVRLVVQEPSDCPGFTDTCR
jgi:hypothetical protein